MERCRTDLALQSQVRGTAVLPLSHGSQAELETARVEMLFSRLRACQIQISFHKTVINKEESKLNYRNDVKTESPVT